LLEHLIVVARAATAGESRVVGTGIRRGARNPGEGMQPVPTRGSFGMAALWNGEFVILSGLGTLLNPATLPLPASGSNDWANAGGAMPAVAIAAIRAILEIVITVFLLATKRARTQCPVSRCRGDRIAPPEFRHGSVIHLGCFIKIIVQSFFLVSGINGPVVQSRDLKPQGSVGF
jgi:hypothetical protein